MDGQPLQDEGSPLGSVSPFSKGNQLVDHWDAKTNQQKHSITKKIKAVRQWGKEAEREERQRKGQRYQRRE